MSRNTRRIANCAMATALGVVLMVVLALTGIGTYAAPMFACLLLAPLQKHYGTPTALTVWLATGLVSLLLSVDPELSLVYLVIIGWYPPLKPWFDHLPQPLRPLKLAAFNLCTVGTYAVMLPFLGLEEEMMEPWLLGTLLVMGNVMFWLLDRSLLGRVVPVLEKRLEKVIKF